MWMRCGKLMYFKGNHVFFLLQRGLNRVIEMGLRTPYVLMHSSKEESIRDGEWDFGAPNRPPY
jgi:hypothetical protein